jgi:branched-chain amino acid transport system permease protein
VLTAEVIQQLVNALTITAVYALVAVGVSLFFGAIGVVNLAHGDLAVIGAFFALAIQQFLVGSYGILDPTVGGLLVFPIGVAGGVLSALALYHFAFKPLKEVPMVIGLLASIAFGFILRESIFNFYPGARYPQTFETIIPSLVFEFSEIFVNVKQIFIIVIAVVMVGGTSALMRHTRFGRSIRSVVNSKEVSRILGVPVERVIAKTFVLGGALAGMGGVLNATYYNQISFDTGLSLTLKGFTAAVIGGLGNYYGALLGSFVIGLFETLTVGFVPQGGLYKDAVVFFILILILILKPEGILGLSTSKKV